MPASEAVRHDGMQAYLTLTASTIPTYSKLEWIESCENSLKLLQQETNRSINNTEHQHHIKNLEKGFEFNSTWTPFL